MYIWGVLIDKLLHKKTIEFSTEKPKNRTRIYKLFIRKGERKRDKMEQIITRKIGTKKERKIPLSFSLTQTEIDTLDGLVNRVSSATGTNINRSQLVAEIVGLLASPAGAKFFESAFDLACNQLSFLDENFEAVESDPEGTQGSEPKPKAKKSK